jgi:hypothetical protein
MLKINDLVSTRWGYGVIVDAVGSRYLVTILGGTNIKYLKSKSLTYVYSDFNMYDYLRNSIVAQFDNYKQIVKTDGLHKNKTDFRRQHGI